MSVPGQFTTFENKVVFEMRYEIHVNDYRLEFLLTKFLTSIYRFEKLGNLCLVYIHQLGVPCTEYLDGGGKTRYPALRQRQPVEPRWRPPKNKRAGQIFA